MTDNADIEELPELSSQLRSPGATSAQHVCTIGTVSPQRVLRVFLDDRPGICTPVPNWLTIWSE